MLARSGQRSPDPDREVRLNWRMDMTFETIERPFADPDGGTCCAACGDDLSGEQVVRVAHEDPDGVYCDLACARRGLSDYFATRDGFEFPGGSSPDWDAYYDADEHGLVSEIHELEALAARAAAQTSPDTLVIENCASEIALLRGALDAVRAGREVRIAHDEDGVWIAHEHIARA